jgi:uncharacterized protein YjiS (DUF1127 family)
MHMTVTAGRSGTTRPALSRFFRLIARDFSDVLKRSRERQALSALSAHLL